ncbi:uncharacterized protein LAESUDRAFT_645083, partial [Laetiporus sulphureus 93-53]
DCCHKMNLALLQIGELPEFAPMIADLKAILVYMHKSIYAAEHFNDARAAFNIKNGLTMIGETCFSTYTWAVISVHDCLPAFYDIISKPELGIVIDILNTHDTIEFEYNLMRFIALTSLFVKAIKCLELAYSTIADVYLFWLTVVAHLADLFINNVVNLSPSTIDAV